MPAKLCLLHVDLFLVKAKVTKIINVIVTIIIIVKLILMMMINSKKNHII